MDISAALDSATNDFINLVASRLGKGRVFQSETTIASAARLAGSLLLRSFDLKVSPARPGAVVLSNEANEELPRMINLLSGMLQHFGVVLDQKTLASDTLGRGVAPDLSVLESLALLQDEAMRIARTHGLSLQQAAQAAAMATAFIVKECAHSIPAEVGFNVAAYGFVEGCKTWPPASGTTPTPAPGKKPWYRFW